VRRSVLLAALPATVLFGCALALRLAQHHEALLYPDGYQYLLMARGIGEHLEPTTVLGPGGDSFVPSPDAAAKPLFPLVVALVHLLGVSWLNAAAIVTAASAAATVVLVALLVARLGGSAWAALGAALLLLASPSLGFWSGFSGPDPLAQALALGAALAFVSRRPAAGGALTGLAIAARPELALLAAAAAVVAVARPGQARRDARRASPFVVATVALVFGVLRPPIAVPDWKLIAIAALALAAVAVAAVAPVMWVRYAAVVGLAAVTFVVASAPAVEELWRDDRALLVVGAAGFLVLLHDARHRPAALLVLGAGVLLGSVYVIKNPALERYVTILLPCVALLAGLAVAALTPRARPVALAVIAVAVAVGFRSPIPGSRDNDVFSMIAASVNESLPKTDALVTAAPDAYGFWLPTFAVREMRPGARGAILLDPAQRVYEPGLTAKGRVVLRIAGEIAFSRPDGELDARPAVVVAGKVVARAHRTLRSTGL
jgi:hypothetical protein